MALLRDAALRGSSPGLPISNIEDAYWTGRKEVERAWVAAERRARRGLPTGVFGKVHVRLVRTGQCTITVDPTHLFTIETIKRAQAGEAALWKAHEAEIYEECRSVAEQCFFVIRDLTHQHYHHEKSSDLLTTVTDWDENNDEDWRRETQYGLMRMAIALRRNDTAQHYRQALGVIAYADAFQKHLCGWYTAGKGVVAASAVRFQYDFAALRSSIDASLKVRELKDANARARLFFAFGTLVTALTLIVPAFRGTTPDVSDVPLGGAPASYWPRHVFDVLVDLAIANPWVALGFTMGAGLAVDYLFVGLAVKAKNYSKIRASISRFLGGVMAFLRRHKVPIRLTQLLVLVGLLGAFATLLLVMIFCFQVLYSQIGR